MRRLEFWIKVGLDEFQLPVNPLEFKPVFKVDHKEVEMLDGYITELATHSHLLEIELESVLLDRVLIPKQYTPKTYMSLFNNIFKANKVFQLYVLNDITNFKRDFVMTEFSYWYEKSNVRYTMKLLEYKRLSVKYISKVELPELPDPTEIEMLRLGYTEEDIEESKNTIENSKQLGDRDITHIARGGETFTMLAKLYYDTTDEMYVEAILNANPDLLPENTIAQGVAVIIPVKVKEMRKKKK